MGRVSNNGQISQELQPTSLEIFNDSHKHAHHKAMVGVTSRETHFRYVDSMLRRLWCKELALH